MKGYEDFEKEAWSFKVQRQHWPCICPSNRHLA
jgi:hypothetical protein